MHLCPVADEFHGIRVVLRHERGQPAVMVRVSRHGVRRGLFCTAHAAGQPIAGLRVGAEHEGDVVADAEVDSILDLRACLVRVNAQDIA